MKLKRIISGILAAGMLAGYALVPGVMPAGTSAVIEASALSKSDTFVKSAYDTAEVTAIYDGSDSTKSIQMKGITYYQGILCDTEYYNNNKTSKMSFNVANAKTVEYTIGHVDNGKTNSAKVSTYLDDVLVDEYTISYTALNTTKEIDVSDASALRLEVIRYSGAAYALANFTVDGAAPSVKEKSPSYTTSELFLAAGFDSAECSVHNVVADSSAVMANGRRFYQGILCNTEYYSNNKTSRMSFNVENVNNVSFTVAHLDNTTRNSAKLSVYLDDVLVEELEYTHSMLNTEYSVDVSGTSVLRLELVRYSGAGYILGDVKVNGIIPKKPQTLPTCANSDLFLKSAYDVYECSTLSVVSDSQTVKAKGRKFYQGIVCDTEYYSNNKSTDISFNVEDVDEVSFTVGHLDNTTRNNAKLSIYLDDVLSEEMNFTATMLNKSVSINVSRASVLRLVLLRYGGAGYILGDVKMNGGSPAKKQVAPGYIPSASFAQSAFDTAECSAFKVTSDSQAVSVNGIKYYNGVKCDTEYYNNTKTSLMSFNVEEIASVAFTVGHIDNGNEGNATMKIYIDDGLAATVEMSSTMLPTRYTYVVEGASVLRIEMERKKGAAYLMFDFETTQGSPVPDPETISVVYRLYNEELQEHLYTVDANEVRTLVGGHGWNYEGSGWIAPNSGAPVYRLYCLITNVHLYTSDLDERDYLLSTNAWTLDNGGKPVFYSSSDGIAIYRVYHEGILRHHLSTSAEEYNILSTNGWNGEDVKFRCIMAGNPNLPMP